MNFETMSNEQIINYIANNIEKERIHKSLSSEELANKGGHNSQTYSNFLNRGSNIKIATLIDIYRGLGELEKLQKAFEFKAPYSPTITQENNAVRVRKKKPSDTPIVWEEDE
jgi:hypothetical protein